MRTLLVLAPASALLLGACSTFKAVAPGSQSQSELDRLASEGCTSSPNTDEHLECRRQTQDSWRDRPAPRTDPPPGFPGTSAGPSE